MNFISVCSFWFRFQKKKKSFQVVSRAVNRFISQRFPLNAVTRPNWVSSGFVWTLHNNLYIFYLFFPEFIHFEFSHSHVYSFDRKWSNFQCRGLLWKYSHNHHHIHRHSPSTFLFLFIHQFIIEWRAHISISLILDLNFSLFPAFSFTDSYSFCENLIKQSIESNFDRCVLVFVSCWFENKFRHRYFVRFFYSWIDGFAFRLKLRPTHGKWWNRRARERWTVEDLCLRRWLQQPIAKRLRLQQDTPTKCVRSARTKDESEDDEARGEQKQPIEWEMNEWRGRRGRVEIVRAQNTSHAEWWLQTLTFVSRRLQVSRKYKQYNEFLSSFRDSMSNRCFRFEVAQKTIIYSFGWSNFRFGRRK